MRGLPRVREVKVGIYVYVCKGLREKEEDVLVLVPIS